MIWQKRLKLWPHEWILKNPIYNKWLSHKKYAANFWLLSFQKNFFWVNQFWHFLATFGHSSFNSDKLQLVIEMIWPHFKFYINFTKKYSWNRVWIEIQMWLQRKHSEIHKNGSDWWSYANRHLVYNDCDRLFIKSLYLVNTPSYKEAICLV